MNINTPVLTILVQKQYSVSEMKRSQQLRAKLEGKTGMRISPAKTFESPLHAALCLVTSLRHCPKKRFFCAKKAKGKVCPDVKSRTEELNGITYSKGGETGLFCRNPSCCEADLAARESWHEVKGTTEFHGRELDSKNLGEKGCAYFYAHRKNIATCFRKKNKSTL